jgi:hypothetical protein
VVSVDQTVSMEIDFETLNLVSVAYELHLEIEKLTAICRFLLDEMDVNHENDAIWQYVHSKFDALYKKRTFISDIHWNIRSLMTREEKRAIRELTNKLL